MSSTCIGIEPVRRQTRRDEASKNVSQAISRSFAGPRRYRKIHEKCFNNHWSYIQVLEPYHDTEHFTVDYNIWFHCSECIEMYFISFGRMSSSADRKVRFSGGFGRPARQCRKSVTTLLCLSGNSTMPTQWPSHATSAPFGRTRLVDANLHLPYNNQPSSGAINQSIDRHPVP